MPLAPDPRRPAAERAIRSRRRRVFGGRLHAAFAIGLAAALAILLSALFLRIDLPVSLPFAARPLDPSTHAQIAALDTPLSITAVIGRNHPARVPAERLLDAIDKAGRTLGRPLSVSVVDPHRDFARAAGLLREFGVSSNAILFESGGRRFAIDAWDLFDSPPSPGDSSSGPAPAGPAPSSPGALPPANPAPPPSGPASSDASPAGLAPAPSAPPAMLAPSPTSLAPTSLRRLGAFRGEAACAAAIARLAARRAPVAYALAGHAERGFDDYDPLFGYSSFAREIRRQGYDLRILPMLDANGIPPDCDVLLSAAPRDALSAAEASLVSDYVMAGGRLLLLARRDVANGFEPLLGRFGISFLPYVATSPRTLTGAEVVSDSFADHPVARGMRNAAVVFNAPGVLSVHAAAPAEDTLVSWPSPHAAPAPVARAGSIVVSSRPLHFRASAVVPAPDGLRRDNASPWPDPLPGERSGLALLAAAEYGSDAADLARRTPRIVVAADPDFASNAMLGHGRNGNRNLLLSALDWLSDNPAAAAVAPADAPVRPAISRRQLALFVALSVAGLPAAVLLLGALCLAARRRHTSPKPTP